MNQPNDISLQGATIVVADEEASYVHHAVGELRRQISSTDGAQPEIAVRTVPRELGPEEFVLRVEDGRTIVAAGGDSMGTNYAVMQLRQLLTESESGLSIPADLNVHERPRYPTRGLYLHQHWRYNHPYATWSWSVEDWKRALDMVACMRINLVMIWPHMDMIAPPLSEAERKHLSDLRELIDYAHRARGLKIWLVEPANVLLDQPEVKRLPMEQRDYYAYAHMEGGGLKNPANPKARAALLANREELYRRVPNADGYGYIDSDPGGWIGSPSSEFVDLLAANRALLDRHHERPKEVELFHWALAGWGTGTPMENWRATMNGVVRQVRPPRAFLACFAPHIEITKELDHLPQTLLFPYGVIDGEPSLPLTALRFDQLQRAFQFMGNYEGMAGIIGNVQTFLIQLPNIFYTSRSCWGSIGDREALLSLARLLFPGNAELLADAWAQLHKTGSAAAHTIAERLDTISKEKKSSRLGTLAQLAFPDAKQILSDLVAMLHVHARAEQVRESPDARVVESVTSFLAALLDWQKRNGFFGTYAADKEVIYDQFIHSQDCETVKSVIARQSDRAALQRKIVGALVERGYTRWIVEAMTGQLFGTQQVKCGRIESTIFAQLPPAKVTMPWTQPK